MDLVQIFSSSLIDLQSFSPNSKPYRSSEAPRITKEKKKKNCQFVCFLQATYIRLIFYDFPPVSLIPIFSLKEVSLSLSSLVSTVPLQSPTLTLISLHTPVSLLLRSLHIISYLFSLLVSCQTPHQIFLPGPCHIIQAVHAWCCVAGTWSASSQSMLCRLKGLMLNHPTKLFIIFA